MNPIEKRLELLKSNITRAAQKNKRRIEDIHLICVTKYAPIKDVVEAVRCGCYEIGENRFQEMRKKYGALGNILPAVEFQKIKWHFIGHLQTNKIKSVLRYASMIQSVDSLNLIDLINKQAKKINRKAELLLQVNISKEDSKFGFDAARARDFLRRAGEYPFLNILGLMGIARFSDNEDLPRREFRALKRLFDAQNEILKENGHAQMSILSMGMSNDYKIAIEEGSNMIRLGSAIFGG
ncbi:MAG: YggS family pyridoxal phosphate-dependent enzyme [Candidatus Omnitrophica bacterium]|nr:YggS family pyridoxal phosphate-dependent enzyme [Candidatus Omnitrophota bacterium]